MSARLAVTVLAAMCLVALGGCGERPQAETAYKQGKYQGKPDTLPWDDAPPAYGSAKWTQGDKRSWEDQIKTRNLSQNEYVRIGH
ncbi:MAG TPA: hypothetical protein VEG36_03910 [Burkholderiales bacterium]|nr:hypothetical protein [Burkholderiales bacterium]